MARGPEAERVFEDLAALAEPLGLTLARHREVLGPGLAFELIGRADQRVEDNDNFLGEFPRRPAIPMGFRLALDATAGNDPARPRLAWCLGLEGALPEDPEATRPPGRERYRPGSPAPASELLRPGPAPAPARGARRRRPATAVGVCACACPPRARLRCVPPSFLPFRRKGRTSSGRCALARLLKGSNAWPC